LPLSHPFVERVVGTIRRDCVDRMLFWIAADLELKLLAFQRYHNGHRACGTGGTYAGTQPGGERRPGECPVVSLAVALSWPLPDAHCGMTYLGDARCRATRHPAASMEDVVR
jgi:hypothetical protein